MKVKEMANRMIIAIMLISLLCVLGSIFYYRSLDFLPFLFGVILGSAASIAKVILLERTVNQAVSMDKQKAKNHLSTQHILRFLISGIVLILGALIPQISLWGVAAGIVASHPAIYIANFSFKKEANK